MYILVTPVRVPLTLSMPVLFCLNFHFCCFHIQQQLCFCRIVFLGFQIPQEVSCKNPLGMENQQISDSAVTASSTMAPSTFLYAPGNARLHYKGGARRDGGWIPAVSDYSQWLQINFGSDRHVTGIATQGYHQGLFYVKSYSLQYVDDRGYLQQYQPEWHTKVSTILRVMSFHFTILYSKIEQFCLPPASHCPCRRSPTVTLSTFE